MKACDQPSAFDFWLEYLHLQRDMSPWAKAFDDARVNWRLDLCWQLLREARRQAETPEERARVRFYEGLLHMHEGNWGRAEACYEAAQAGLPDSAVGLRFSLLGERGMLARLQGNGQAALAFHQQQYTLAEKYEDTAWKAEALDHIAMDHELLNNWEVAHRNLKSALILYEALEDIEGIAGCHNRLGLITLRMEQFTEASKHLERAQELFMQLEQPFALAQVEGNLGNLAYAEGKWNRAAQYYQRALQRFDDLGVAFDKIGILNNLGSLALAHKDWKAARQFYEEALHLARDLGDQREVRDVLVNLGVWCVQQENFDEAKSYYAQALEITRELGDRGMVRDIRGRQIRLGLLRSLNWVKKRIFKHGGNHANR